MFIVALSTAIIEALRETFDAQYAASNVKPRSIHIEYPEAESDWPAVFVQIEPQGDITWSGLDPDIEIDPNMMTVNQATLETNVNGWVAYQNSLVTRSTAKAKSGVASLRMEAVALGNQSASTTPGVGGFAVIPEKLYAVGADFSPVATPRSVQVGIAWFRADGTLISESFGSTKVESGTDAWTPVTHSDKAPVGAFRAAQINQVLDCSAGEVHHSDEHQFERGEATPYASPPPDPTKPHRLFREGNFVANIMLTILALTSQERDVLWDNLVQLLLMGRKRTDTDDFFAKLEEHDLIRLTVQEGIVQNVGRTANPGTPWGTEQLVYEGSIQFVVVGQFWADVYTEELVSISAFGVHPFSPDQADVPYGDADGRGAWQGGESWEYSDR